jgi:iron-sulfur cluster repair protein YtfE (RIC family)
MNAIDLLQEDHNKVSRLFQKVKATEGENHQKLFEQIREELEAHTHIEETIFYPEMKKEKELEDLILEGIEEHHQVKMFLREIGNLVNDSEKFDPKLKVLIEDVEHHVQEEEGQMFPKIRELFDATVLNDLGSRMQEEKRKFQKSRGAGAGG